MMRLAGIDIGTLTCRLLVAQVSPPHFFQEMDSDRRILRLGEGVDSHKNLSGPAMERVLNVLKEWRGKLKSYSLDDVVVVATSAVRDAQNRQEFLDRVFEEVGWNVEVLTGEEEARRTLWGIRFGLPEGVQEFLAVDIGGGSTEFMLGGPTKNPLAISLELGVVRLTERVFSHDPPTHEELLAGEAEIVRQLEVARETFGPDLNLPSTLVGTAGTITTLAAMDQGLVRYERDKVHNYALSLASVRRLEKILFGQTSSQRLGIPGLEPGREQVIAAGTVILRQTMEYFGYSHCRVSDFGLREGVLVDRAHRE